MNRKVLLTLILSLAVVCWCGPAAAYTLKVRAWIDGRSLLLIQGNSVQWHNLNYNCPGYEGHQKSPLPTYLNTYQDPPGKTVKWLPKGWSNGTSGDTTSAQFTKLNLPLAAAEQTVTLAKIAWQGPVSIVQQPSVANGFQLIVEFNDNSYGGAYWYEVNLHYIPGLGVKSTYQELGLLEGMLSSQVYAINSKGQATGQSWIIGYSRGFFWDPKTKTMLDLGAPPEWDNSRGDVINSKGQVAGQLITDPLTHIFLWDPKTEVMQDLGNLGGNGAWIAWRYGINDKGQLCGSSETSPGGPWNAFFWDPKTKAAQVQSLGTLEGGTDSYAHAINSGGKICGYSTIAGNAHAFLWDPKTKTMQDLGTLTGGTWSHAYAINSKGQICGDSDAAGTGGNGHAFFWDPKTKTMQDLGTLAGGTFSYALHMNSKGQVIGNADAGGAEHAFFWDPKTKVMVDLGTLGGSWSRAWAINKAGQVAGRSQAADGKEHGFLWDPKTKIMRDTGTPLGGTESGADDLNSKGRVAGYATYLLGQKAIIWTP